MKRIKKSKLRNWGERLLGKRSSDDRCAFADRLRAFPTPAERRVIGYLDYLHIPYAFQKQRGPFVADFYIKHYKLIIEIDGASHRGRQQYDKMRDDWCRANGFRIVRVTNEQTLSLETFVCSAPNFFAPLLKSTSRKFRPAQELLKKFQDGSGIDDLGVGYRTCRKLAEPSERL